MVVLEEMRDIGLIPVAVQMKGITSQGVLASLPTLQQGCFDGEAKPLKLAVVLDGVILVRVLLVILEKGAVESFT